MTTKPNCDCPTCEVNAAIEGILARQPELKAAADASDVEALNRLLDLDCAAHQRIAELRAESPECFEEC